MGTFTVSPKSEEVSIRVLSKDKYVQYRLYKGTLRLFVGFHISFLAQSDLYE